MYYRYMLPYIIYDVVFSMFLWYYECYVLYDEKMICLTAFSHWWLNLIVGQIRLVFCQLSVNTYVSVDRLALWGDSNEYQQHISLCSSNQVRWCYSISSLHAFAIYTHQTPLYYKLNVRFTGAWTLFSYFCS